MRITVFSAACEALFTSGRGRFHCFRVDFAGFDNCTPDSVPASLSGVSCFDGVISIKTPDFSLFSLPLKNIAAFAVLPECRSCPCLFSGVFRHWHAPVRSNTWGHGAASLAGSIPFGRSCIFQGAVVSRQVQFNEKSGCSRISKRLENRCEKRKFPPL